jgi:hypothetical protein
MTTDPLQDVPSSDYCEYFFLRSRLGGFVIGTDSNDGGLVPQIMLAHNRGSQLFRFQAIPGNNERVQIIHQATGNALSALPTTGILALAPPDSQDLGQQWTLSARNQLQQGNASVGIVIGDLGFCKMELSDPNFPGQQFELLYPSDFVYIRNSWTGRVLTTDDRHGASWQQMNPAATDYQQWGITSDGFVVSRATAEVLQLASSFPFPPPPPQAGVPLTTGPQVSLLNPVNKQDQKFDVMNPDGTIKTPGGFVIGMNGSEAVTAVYSTSDYTQLAEPLSPFQFFGLQNGADDQACLVREGEGSTLASWSGGGDNNQLFTVSRYGEIISPVDGFVLQSQGSGAVPTFVDPAPEPIGFDTTTFQYGDSSAAPGYGQISLRNNLDLGLLVNGGGTAAVPLMDSLQSPVSGAQAWQMLGPDNGLFATFQDVAREFFANPAPLPGQPSMLAFAAEDPQAAQLVENVPKSARVIITLVLGILDIAAGVTVGRVANSVVEQVAKVALGSSEVAAKVAVIMQGTVTAASIIAVADGITKAGLWWQILKLLIPNSFWGWALTIAKLGLTIAAWVVGAGPAVTGAKIALLCADIIAILNSDVAAARAEAAALTAYVERRNAAKSAGETVES